MSHANAALTPRARLRLARLIVEDGWPCRSRRRCSWSRPSTARKVGRPVRAEGPAGMADRSSSATLDADEDAAEVVKRIVALRWRRRLGPVQIGGELGLPASTVHAVLVRCRINRLTPYRPGHRRTHPPLRA